jgi:hypothetical protein
VQVACRDLCQLNSSDRTVSLRVKRIAAWSVISEYWTQLPSSFSYVVPTSWHRIRGSSWMTNSEVHWRNRQWTVSKRNHVVYLPGGSHDTLLWPRSPNDIRKLLNVKQECWPTAKYGRRLSGALGRAIAQAVSRRLPTAVVRVGAQMRWDLWWTKWFWDKFSPSTSVSPANSNSTDCSTFIIYHPGLAQLAS